MGACVDKLEFIKSVAKGKASYEKDMLLSYVNSGFECALSAEVRKEIEDNYNNRLQEIEKMTLKDEAK